VRITHSHVLPSGLNSPGSLVRSPPLSPSFEAGLADLAIPFVRYTTRSYRTSPHRNPPLQYVCFDSHPFRLSHLRPSFSPQHAPITSLLRLPAKGRHLKPQYRRTMLPRYDNHGAVCRRTGHRTVVGSVCSVATFRVHRVCMGWSMEL
jgi:hypothetical protein